MTRRPGRRRELPGAGRRSATTTAARSRRDGSPAPASDTVTQADLDAGSVDEHRDRARAGDDRLEHGRRRRSPLAPGAAPGAGQGRGAGRRDRRPPDADDVDQVHADGDQRRQRDGARRLDRRSRRCRHWTCDQPVDLAPGEKLTCTGTRRCHPGRARRRPRREHRDGRGHRPGRATRSMPAPTRRSRSPQVPHLTLAKEGARAGPTASRTRATCSSTRLTATNDGNVTLDGPSRSPTTSLTTSWTRRRRSAPRRRLDPGEWITCTAQLHGHPGRPRRRQR